MKIVMLLVLSFLYCSAMGQDTTMPKPRLRFLSTTQAGHIEGSKGGAFLVQTVNGLQYRGWGAGVGFGLDNYRMRSLPLFFHLRRRVPLGSVPLFVYGDVGHNFVWEKHDFQGWGVNARRSGGRYWDAGLQYHLVLRNRNALVFSTGYSTKVYTETTVSPVWCVTGNCPEIENEYRYRYRRLVFKAGFAF